MITECRHHIGIVDAILDVWWSSANRQLVEYPLSLQVEAYIC